MDKTSDAHLNPKQYNQNWVKLKLYIQKSFSKYLKKANLNLLTKCTNKIC